MVGGDGGNGSINFVMCADTFEQDGCLPLVLHELEHHTQIITGAARPRTNEFAFELVRLELRMKSVLGQQTQNRLQLPGSLGLLAGEPAGGTDERRRWQEQPFQAKMRLMIWPGEAGRQLPALNSRRADFTASTSSARRRSVTRC